MPTATGFATPFTEMKMKIETWSLDRLYESPLALRKHDKAVDRMARALLEFGFRLPVLVKSGGEIVDGALRVKAARQIGFSEVPVIVVDDLSDARLRALRLLLNRSSSWAAWNESELAREISDLAALDLDLTLTGFDPAELEKYLKLAAPSGDDLDAAPPLEKTAVSQPGDLWILGDHRLYCGDATDAASYAALLEGRKADCVWTDPPYGVDYSGGAKKKRAKIVNDNLDDEAFYPFLLNSFNAAVASLKAGGAFYAAHADLNRDVFSRAFSGAGLSISSILVWVKNNFVLSRHGYHWRHEPILYGVKPGAPRVWHGDRKQNSVLEVFPGAVQGQDERGRDFWQVIDGGHIYRIFGRDVEIEELAGSVFYAPKPAASALHPTMKPVALISAMLVNSTLRGELVLDPFSGSGSTLMACESLGRACAAIELDPLYCDCVIRRWQDATGLSAIHACGAAFDERDAA